MKIYVWKNIDQVSDNYHRDGGLLVIAEDELQARALANETPHVKVLDDDKPLLLGDIYGATPRVMTFPNAGCC